MIEIPLQPIPSQIVKIVLDKQQCQIGLHQKPQGLFFDLNTNGVDIVNGVLVLDAVPLVLRQYLGFRGDFVVTDTQGKTTPIHTGLGSRFSLVYLTEAERGIIHI